MKKPLYEKNALKEGIRSCQKNIETFQKAITKERETIIKYSTLIKEHELYEQTTKESKT